MPIYQYEPTIYSLDEEVSECCFFDILQGINELSLSVCPTCKHPVHRAITSFSVKIKTSIETNSPSNSKPKEKNPAGVFSSVNSESSKDENSASASRIASMALRHVCSAGCKH